jgi:hypothetical protein
MLCFIYLNATFTMWKSLHTQILFHNIARLTNRNRQNKRAAGGVDVPNSGMPILLSFTYPCLHAEVYNNNNKRTKNYHTV